jgi:hypothetical protein
MYTYRVQKLFDLLLLCTLRVRTEILQKSKELAILVDSPTLRKYCSMHSSENIRF